MLFNSENDYKDTDNNISIPYKITNLLHRVLDIYTKISNSETLTSHEHALLNQIPNIEKFVNTYIKIIKESENTTEIHPDLQKLIELLKK